MREVISTKDAPQAIGPYSQAIKANGFIFVSGQIAIDPATHHVFVTSSFVDNNAPSSVSVIDERTNTIDFRITVGVEPEGVTVDPLTDAAYVANTQSGTISVLTPS